MPWASASEKILTLCRLIEGCCVNTPRASTGRGQFGSDLGNIKTDVQRKHIMRTGKIARLPHPIREQLNRRLESAEAYEPILNWLNTLPEAWPVINLM